MKDTYYIIWNDNYSGVEVIERNSQEECEKELNILLAGGEEVRIVIVGKELTWKTHIQTGLKEE